MVAIGRTSSTIPMHACVRMEEKWATNTCFTKTKKSSKDARRILPQGVNSLCTRKLEWLEYTTNPASTIEWHYCQKTRKNTEGHDPTEIPSSLKKLSFRSRSPAVVVIVLVTTTTTSSSTSSTSTRARILLLQIYFSRRRMEL